MCIAMKTLQFLFKNSMKNRSTKKSLYDIHIYLGNYWVKMLQEAQWKNMVETETLDHIHRTSLFFFHRAHSIQMLFMKYFTDG